MYQIWKANCMQFDQRRVILSHNFFTATELREMEKKATNGLSIPTKKNDNVSELQTQEQPAEERGEEVAEIGEDTEQEKSEDQEALADKDKLAEKIKDQMERTSLHNHERIGFENTKEPRGKKGKPKWKIRLELKIKKLRGDLSNLKNLRQGQLKNKQIKSRLAARYDLENKEIAVVIEELKKTVVATAEKIKRYENRLIQFQQN
ncbi:hypothetical protein E2320_011098 [Naja naja]|nr:hypothetical protein E2320_011098 [Naja naja]